MQLRDSIKFILIISLLTVCYQTLPANGQPKPADIILINGKIVTLDNQNHIYSAIAISKGKILGLGSDDQIKKLSDSTTNVIDLKGKMVLPGLIETHVHALGVASNALHEPYVELKSIAEIQQWLRKRAKEIPAGRGIRVPRTDITRLKERRHPTPQELDAACTTHPVVFTAARKSALNSLGFKLLGLTDKTKTIHGSFIKRDQLGNPLLISGGNASISKLFPRKIFSTEEKINMLIRLHQVYNSVGITSINERALNKEGVEIYQQLRDDKQLKVRTTCTIRQQFRSGQQVVEFTKKFGMKTGDGDDWVHIGPLKITVDGGIHWGTTFLREQYGKKRIQFYALEGIQSPDWMGSIKYSQKQMTEIFTVAHQQGWQMCTHVTGDAGVDRILNALEETNRNFPITKRRFNLTHAYFPIQDAIVKGHRLGICVDTQPYLYYKDSDAIAQVYGESWAKRFLGVGAWVKGGIPTAINADHMIGFNPNHALQSFNPFLQMSIVIRRINEQGETHGAHQKISREQALRCCTSMAAYLDFNEKKKGSLQKGYLADMIVIDRNYFTCPEKEIEQIKVLTTMLDGKIVYRHKK